MAGPVHGGKEEPVRWSRASEVEQGSGGDCEARWGRLEGPGAFKGVSGDLGVRARA